ncbi:sialidase family protein [Intrasporangium oryzae]|uniref:sialidase family protein n=1 Tax=Intrasporangium oryzae TaxID=412687 RepID=UPI0012F92145|nr:sialidase family protein [Intrasporangium oryzae]
MRKRAIVVAGVACLALVVVAGVSPSVASTVVSNGFVTNDLNRDAETDIAINPVNPANLIAAWGDSGAKSCGVGYSMDGGQTWQVSWIHGLNAAEGNPDFAFAGDPSVGFLNDGTAVVACDAWGPGLAPSALYTSRSTDGGQTWEPAVELARGKKVGHLHDHPMLTIDRYGDRVLLAYTVFLGTKNSYARSYALVSADGGLTYQGPYEIAADYRADAPWRFDVSLAGAPDGTIYATAGIWNDISIYSEQAVVVSQLRPGEARFTRSVKVRDLVPAPETLPNELWRTSMQASIGVEADGTVDLMTGDYATGNLDIYLAKSTDHGESFPSQTNLTNDEADQVMPWMSVAPNGRIDVVYYDYTRSTATLDAVYGQIPPGGSTMTRQVVDASIPQGSFMGDYLGIDSTDAQVALSWTAGRRPYDDWLEIKAASLLP